MDRYIFDIDGTLLFMNWEAEDELFKNLLNEEEFKLFSKIKMDVLYSYEDNHHKYDIDLLANYFKKYGINMTDKMIKEWIYCNGYVAEDTLAENAIEVLEHLKKENKKLSILTNWFSATQIPRLKRAGIYDYFDTIICGDQSVKPKFYGYVLAAGQEGLTKSIMIGDNKDKDYIFPKAYGMKAYLVSDDNPLIKVKSIGSERNGIKRY